MKKLEPRFSIDKQTGVDLGVDPFKEWYVANNLIYDYGRSGDSPRLT